jgi:hypothetical protein
MGADWEISLITSCRTKGGKAKCNSNIDDQERIGCAEEGLDGPAGVD